MPGKGSGIGESNYPRENKEPLKIITARAQIFRGSRPVGRPRNGIPVEVRKRRQYVPLQHATHPATDDPCARLSEVRNLANRGSEESHPEHPRRKRTNDDIRTIDTAKDPPHREGLPRCRRSRLRLACKPNDQETTESHEKAPQLHINRNLFHQDSNGRHENSSKTNTPLGHSALNKEFWFLFQLTI